MVGNQSNRAEESNRGGDGPTLRDQGNLQFHLCRMKLPEGWLAQGTFEGNVYFMNLRKI